MNKKAMLLVVSFNVLVIYLFYTGFQDLLFTESTGYLGLIGTVAFVFSLVIGSLSVYRFLTGMIEVSNRTSSQTQQILGKINSIHPSEYRINEITQYQVSIEYLDRIKIFDPVSSNALIDVKTGDSVLLWVNPTNYDDAYLDLDFDAASLN